MTKKYLAVLISPLVTLLFWFLPSFLYSYYGRYKCELHSFCNFVNNEASPFLILLVVLSWPTLPISIPALFIRKEVHDIWFKWMMCVYMPIACIFVFWVASVSRDSGAGGFGPRINGLETVAAVLIVSVLFIVLSIALILAKSRGTSRKPAS